MKKKQFIILLSSLLAIFFSFNCSSSKEGTSEEKKEPQTAVKPEVQIKNSVTIAPRMLIKEERYVFKDIEEGKEVVHEWDIKNIGSDTLYINDIETSCGCTAAIPDTKILAPDKATKIKVTFNTSGRIGINTKFITVSSNDSVTPNKVLTLEGRVIPKAQPKSN